MKSLTKFIAVTCTVLFPCISYAADFKLCEFAGNYISYSSSAGGNTVADPSSVATTSVSQFKLNKHGTGIVNFVNITVFSTTSNHTTQSLFDLPIEYTLTDAELGIGTLTIFNYPITGTNLFTTFVASRDHLKHRKHGGSVNQIFFNINNNSTPILRNASVIIANRQ